VDDQPIQSLRAPVEVLLAKLLQRFRYQGAVKCMDRIRFYFGPTLLTKIGMKRETSPDAVGVTGVVSILFQHVAERQEDDV